MPKMITIELQLTLLLLIMIISPCISIGFVKTNESRSDIPTPPTTDDINRLVSRFISVKSESEQLYLIYFNTDQDLKQFTEKYPVEIIFRGLKGVVIYTTPKTIDSLVKESRVVTQSNIFHIRKSPRNMVLHHSPPTTITPYIQTEATAAKIGVTQMWGLGFKGQGVTIGIFDTGVFAGHPDFSFPNGTSRILGSQSFINTIYGNSENKTNTPDFHGTGVAGFAAGGGINDSSKKGMAPESWLLDADMDETSDSSLETTVLGEIAAINWAIENGVDIINRSYGPTDPETGTWNMLLDPNERIGYYTIRRAIENGVLFVHSAGNLGGGDYRIDGTNLIDEISVGATGESMVSRAIYSSTGPVWGTNAMGPDVVAPGTNIPTTSPEGGYFTTDGTSQSSPHVAGAAAVLLSAMRQEGLEVNPGTLKASLMGTAMPIISDNPWEHGTGQINVYNAYLALMNATKINNHPIYAATNPLNISNYVPGTYPIPNLLQGMVYKSAHFTFVSSEMENVSVTIEGNISNYLNIKEQVLVNYTGNGLRYSIQDLNNGLLSKAYSHDLILSFDVPNDTPIGQYSGRIVFKVNDTILLDFPYLFTIGLASKQVLLHTRTTADFAYNSLGDFRNMIFDLSKKGIVLNENKAYLTTSLLNEYDVIWLVASNITYKEYYVDSFFYYLDYKNRNSLINATEQETIKDYVKKGGALLLSPISTPLGMESLLKDWGIFTNEITPSIGITPATIQHLSPIGSSADYFDVSGSFFSIENPAMALAYHNRRSNIAMASYDYPLGGRIVVTSGSIFISNRGYLNEISTFETHNDLILQEIFTWLQAKDQLFGTYELVDETISISLHVSQNGTINNSAYIEGVVHDPSRSLTTNISDLIPNFGVNGWYNFSTSIDQGIRIFNFSWNSEYVGFEIITDTTPPIIGVKGMENNSYLYKTEEIIFWFDDYESGIDQFQAFMQIDGEKTGFNGPKANKTHSGFYIEKNLYPENFESGSHIIKLTVQDLAGNPKSINFVFIRGYPPKSTTSQKSSPGFEWILLLSVMVCVILLPSLKSERDK